MPLQARITDPPLSQTSLFLMRYRMLIYVLLLLLAAGLMLVVRQA